MSDDKEPPKDPIDEFDAVSDDGGPPVRMVGAHDENETPEQEAERKKRAREQLDRDAVTKAMEEDKDAEKAGQDKDGKKGAAVDDTEDSEEEKNSLYDVSGFGRHGITDKGDYLKLKGKGKRDPRSGQREITDTQLRLTLMMVVLNKGWGKDITIYRGSNIDPSLTSRANIMLQSDPAFTKACRGCDIPRAETTLKEEPPAFAKSGWARWTHKRKFEAQQKTFARQDKDVTKEVVDKLADKFTPESEGGQSIRDRVAEVENPQAKTTKTAAPGPGSSAGA